MSTPVEEEAPTWRGNACQGLEINDSPAEREEIHVKSTVPPTRATRKQRRAERAIAERAIVAREREREFPEVWKQAKRLALAAGSLTVTEKYWRLAYRQIIGKAVPR